MGFRLKHGLNALGALCVLVACNTYTSDLLVPADVETTSDTTDATLTSGSGSGGSSGTITTTINSVTSSTSSGGDGGSGSGSSSAGNQTTTDGGGSGGDSNTSSAATDTTSTTTTGNPGSGGSDNTGGSDSTGGSGGSGGSDGSSTTGATIDVLLIDDLEDGNNQLETPTYSGYWFTAVDPTGSGEVLPEPGEQCKPEKLTDPRGDSKYAMHVTGTWTDGEEWIAAVGFALHDDEDPVDASSYAGVTFYARTDDEDTRIRLQLMITDVKDDGHYAIELDLSSSWQKYTVLWDNPLLIQPTWAKDTDFDPAHLYKFQFQFDSETFDLWIDDIRFVEP